MGKSILIMETPKACLDCRFVSEINYGTVIACCEIMNEPQDERLQRTIEVYYLKEKPNWCPLVEMPNKREQHIFPRNSFDGFDNGWNTCIDEILKHI